MATYVTKRCPHCGYAYQFLQSGDQRKYGCPYQTCLRCNNSYWDTDIKEPALHGYENFHEVKERIMRGIILAIYTLLGILAFGGGIFLMANGEMIGLALVAAGCGISWIIISFIKQKIHEKKHRDEIIVNRQRDYDESMIRLKDDEYLTALAEHDFLAKKLLKERTNSNIEHYAKRPQ